MISYLCALFMKTFGKDQKNFLAYWPNPGTSERGSYSLRFFISGGDTRSPFVNFPGLEFIWQMWFSFMERIHNYDEFLFFKYQKSSLNGKLTLCCFQDGCLVGSWRETEWFVQTSPWPLTHPWSTQIRFHGGKPLSYSVFNHGLSVEIKL